MPWQEDIEGVHTEADHKLLLHRRISWRACLGRALFQNSLSTIDCVDTELIKDNNIESNKENTVIATDETSNKMESYIKAAVFSFDASLASTQSETSLLIQSPPHESFAIDTALFLTPDKGSKKTIPFEFGWNKETDAE